MILFRSTITLDDKNSLRGRGGHINTCQDGETFQREKILIKRHCTSLICKIISPTHAYGSGHTGKYLYESSKPSFESDHNYSVVN